MKKDDSIIVSVNSKEDYETVQKLNVAIQEYGEIYPSINNRLKCLTLAFEFMGDKRLTHEFEQYVAAKGYDLDKLME